MNPSAQRENARTLAAALGIGETDATEVLNVSVAITFGLNDTVSAECANHIQRLLSRTIKGVVLNPSDKLHRFTAEIVIGGSAPRFKGPHVFVSIGTEEILISSQPISVSRGNIHPICLLLGACYAVGAALRAALNNLLPFPSPELLRVDLTEILGENLSLLYRRVFFDQAYLAGAGAIGNGFVYGLGCFDVAGELHVTDEDTVTDGNLQRCVLFEAEHIGSPKANQLCAAARRLLPKLAAIPHTVRLQDVPTRFAGPWLKRLIVGVDSPRARRSLQTEIPQEVFDASTTGISEIVLHFHRQPTNGACMSCIYHHSPQEDAHERHVADALGVSVTDVMEMRISAKAAERICLRYPLLKLSALVGIAYDTLFKQLCATAQLKSAEDRQVLTPFAFVSALGGAWLAIEFVRRIQRGHDGLFNEWRVSPWSNPVMRRQRFLQERADCQFCGDGLVASLASQMWPHSTSDR
jgi:E1 ligase-like protein/ThiF family protein